MKAVPLTVEHALALAPHLGPVDRAEILLTHPNLETWARSRAAGSAWALMKEGAVIAAGGVLTEAENEGVLWMAGREDWARRHIRHAMRIFDVIKGFGGYAALRCSCVEQNQVARRFARRLGFDELGTENGFVHYGMAT